MNVFKRLSLGQFVPEHHTLPGQKSHLMAPDHLGGIEFDLQLVWSAQSFDSPYQLWRATSSYSRYISLMKSNAGKSEKCMEHHVTDCVCGFRCDPGKTTLGSTQSSSFRARCSLPRHGLTLGTSLFPAQLMHQRSMSPWCFSIDKSQSTLKWLSVSCCAELSKNHCSKNKWTAVAFKKKLWCTSNMVGVF